MNQFNEGKMMQCIVMYEYTTGMYS